MIFTFVLSDNPRIPGFSSGLSNINFTFFRPSLRKKQENASEPENSNFPEPAPTESVVEPESILESPPTETEEIFVDSDDPANPPVDTSPAKTSDTLSSSRINDAIEAALQDMDILDEKVSYYFPFVIYELIYYGLLLRCMCYICISISFRL